MNITVIIPLYNAEQYISKALDSCLQFSEVQEIIVIDDGHKDNAREIVKEYTLTFSFIKLLQHPNRENRGASASRNLGIRHATQEFIAFLDADDFYLSNRFLEDKKVFLDHPDADGCYNALGTHFYSEEAKLQFEKHFRSRKVTTVSADKNPTPHNLLAGLSKLIKGYGYFSLDCLTVKRKSLLKYNLFFNEELCMHEDTDFIFKLAYYCKIYPSEIQEETAKRGVHVENRITRDFGGDQSEKHYYRSLQYDSIYKWAKKENINPAILSIYKERYDFYRLAKFKNPKITHLCKEVFKDPGILKNDKLIPLLQLYTKDGGKLKRAIFYRIPKYIYKISK